MREVLPSSAALIPCRTCESQGRRAFPRLALGLSALLLAGAAWAENPLDKLKAQMDQIQRQRAGQPAVNAANAANAAGPTPGNAGWAAGVGASEPLGGDFGSPEGTARLAAAAPRLDVVGIRLGMPAGDAQALLKGYPGNLLVETAPLEFQAMPGKVLTAGLLGRTGSWIPRLAGNQATGEGIMVGLTTAPSTTVVWSVHRQLEYNQPNTRPASENVAAALLEKYGKPTVSSAGTSQREFLWIFDVQGHVIPRVTSTQMSQMGSCNGGYFTRIITNEPHGWMIPMNDLKSNLDNGFQRSVGGFWNQYCASVGAILEARIDDQEPGRAREVKVTLSDPRLKWSAVEATRKMLIDAQNGVQAREMDAARARGTPKF